jgi:hypothetical protein
LTYTRRPFCAYCPTQKAQGNFMLYSKLLFVSSLLLSLGACQAATTNCSDTDSCSSTGGGDGNVGGNGNNNNAGNSGSSNGGNSNSGGNNNANAGGKGGSNTGGSSTTGGNSGSAGATGTGGTASGGAGGTPVVGVAGGGYIKAGTWKGYGWTAVGGMSTITPKDFALVTDFPLCATGSVPAGNANVAMIGLNLNQGSAAGEVAMTVTPMLKGIKVGLKNNAGSTLRIQIQGPKGATDENDRWCAVIPGTGGFIPYEAFNTQCWSGGMGKPYANQPIVAAMVMVPGAAAAATNFDFCITALVEANSDAAVAGKGCDLSGGPGDGGGTITGDDTRSVTRGGRNYIVQNNVWNGSKTAQSLSVTGVSFEVKSQGNSQGTSGAPAGFPSVFAGSNFGRSSSGSGLPKQVSALKSVPTGWRWAGNAGGQWNAAYDVWFSKNAGGDSGSPSAGFLMVWLHDPDGAQPLGSPSGTETVAGKSWQVWTCPGNCQNGVSVISYVPANNANINELTFDLNDFIKNAQQKYPALMQPSWYLTNIFAGFEIWNGGLGLKTQDFCAAVE